MNQIKFDFKPCNKCSTESLQQLRPSEDIEDGCYFCRLCFEHLCVEHLCVHMQLSYRGEDYSRYATEEFERASVYSKENVSTVDVVDALEQFSSARRIDIRSSDDRSLKIRLTELMAEAKAISRELEKRSIDCARLQHSEAKKQVKYTSELLNAIEFIKKQIAGGIAVERIKNGIQSIDT